MAKVTRPKARINLGLQKEYDRNEIERMSFKKYRETFFCLHSTYNELLTMPKALTVDHNKLWKNLKKMGIPDHLTCLLRNLYACQEATVRTGHRTTD